VTSYPWGARTTDDEDDLLHLLAAPSGVARVTAGSHMQGPAAGCTWSTPRPRRRYRRRRMLPSSSPSLTALLAALNVADVGLLSFDSMAITVVEWNISTCSPPLPRYPMLLHAYARPCSCLLACLFLLTAARTSVDDGLPLVDGWLPNDWRGRGYGIRVEFHGGVLRVLDRRRLEMRNDCLLVFLVDDSEEEEEAVLARHIGSQADPQLEWTHTGAAAAARSLGISKTKLKSMAMRQSFTHYWSMVRFLPHSAMATTFAARIPDCIAATVRQLRAVALLYSGVALK